MKNVRITIWLAATVGSLAGWAGQASAVTVAFEPSKDNTLYESATGASSNGAGDSLFAGMTAANLARRAVLAFDVAQQIPPGSIINSASLSLTVTRNALTPVAGITVHALGADWGEGTSDGALNEGGGASATAGDATWIHRFFPNQFWSTEGGDFAPVPSAAAAVGGIGTYSWSSAELAADVQGWVDNPGSNFGWAVVGEESASTTARRFGSRENVNPATRPVLTVDYSPPPAATLVLTASANQASFTTGDTVDLSVSATNPGRAESVDVYVVILLPDGDTMVNFVGLDGAFEIGSLSNLGGLAPMVPSLSLGAAFNVSLSPFFTYEWRGAEPEGRYSAFLVMAQAGSLSDGSIDPGDLVQFGASSFTFNP